VNVLLSWISSADFDYRLTASLGPREAFRTENCLCVVRSFLALCFCVWVRLVPLDPALPTWHGHVLLIATVEFYFLYSWLMLVLLHVYRAADSIYCLTAFVIDLFAAAAVTAFAA